MIGKDLKLDIALKYLKNVHEKAPLVHNIANYVSINACANITLAAGAKPIMADYYKDVVYITEKSDALVLNLGMMSDDKLRAAIAAGRAAMEKRIPIIVDPVGIGSSEYRRGCFDVLLNETAPAVIRGNESEIRALTGAADTECGVDSGIGSDVASVKCAAADAARLTGAVIFVSGESDVITDGRRTAVIASGDPILRYVTGAGCMLTSLVGAVAAANRDAFMSAVSASVIMGAAAKHAAVYHASGAMTAAIIDEVYSLIIDWESLNSGK